MGRLYRVLYRALRSLEQLFPVAPGKISNKINHLKSIKMQPKVAGAQERTS
jgi:hypothetical protein